MEYVIAFKNTNYAIKAEQSLLEKDFRVNVMPLPSEIRAGCGICLRIPAEEIEAAMKTLTESNIGQTELFLRIEDSGKFAYKRAEGEDVLWSKN